MNKLYLLAVVTIFLFDSCNRNLIDEKAVSEKFCNYFNENKVGSIDSRLNICMNRYIMTNRDEIQKKYSNSKQDSAIAEFSRNVILHMVENCESFYIEIDHIYTNIYSLDTSRTIREEIKNLKLKYSILSDQDSILHNLHETLSKELQDREYKNAIVTAQEIQKTSINDIGSLLATAYAYNGLKDYDNAIIYLDKALSISNNKDYSLFKAITIKRKENGS
jgi:tetratricopeptide (TPR) repeat protein